MSNPYNFTVTLYRPGTTSLIQIDPDALYGYWERQDGSEGGGLWFQRLADGRLELIDFDGASVLPAAWVRILRAEGYVLDESFGA